jgi:class 3 adenylate cyclase/tetratricopeptide (TPR) repeat protein
VTVVFCDVTGSTSLGERLDPESLRKVMARYFEAMKGVLERHGGTVEKFIGDAVMAVFGIPRLHEDDALRAVRAVSEMREALTSLNKELERDHGTTLEVRIGVNTGEVVAGDPSSGQTLVTGDAVNVAARLEQAAAPGEVLIGEATHRLVKDAVAVEAVGPVEVKGKEGAVLALRLVSVAGGVTGPARRLESPMIGREGELRMLHDALDRVIRDRACQLFTVLGPAGVGKSRLVEEFLAGLAEALVLRGRCLPYGEGITYYPVIEVVKQAAGLADFDAPEVVEEKVCAILEGEEHQDVVCRRVSQLLGVAEVAAPEETFWAIRRMLEAVARARPLVIAFDDIHWGEPTFLDLVEHVADWSREVPILLLCTARPDLLDVRPGWAGGKLNAATISLEPLTEAECDRLIENLLGAAEIGEEARRRIADAAEGTPLFVEEMLSMLIDEGLLAKQDGRWVPTADLTEVPVPPTITALLAARLDRLTPEERAVIERASVVGKVFYRGAVRALLQKDLEAHLDQGLRSLVRKELVRPERSTLPGEDAFRFRHVLIRDAAYEAMPKELRSELHERFAGWLEGVAGDRIAEQEEILGYHLERACRLRTELGPPTDAVKALADSAARRLSSAGRRAFERGDASAAANLFGRAVEMIPGGDPARPALLLELGTALSEADLARAIEVLEEAIGASVAAGERTTEWRARVEQVWIRANVQTDRPWAEEERRVSEEAISVLYQLGDDVGLAEAWWALSDVHNQLGRASEMVEAAERSLEHARRAGRAREVANAALQIALGLFVGPIPVPEAIARLRELDAEFGHLPPVGLGAAAWGLGLIEALGGRFAQARSIIEDRADVARGYGNPYWIATVAYGRGRLEGLAGESAAAERYFREAFETYSAIGARAILSTLTGDLALALTDQGKNQEALALAETSRELGGPDDAATQILWREARAVALAALGKVNEAEQLAREAVAIARRTDRLELAEVLVALGEILRADGRPAEARPLVEEALGAYQAKGAVPLVERTRTLLERLAG